VRKLAAVLVLAIGIGTACEVRAEERWLTVDAATTVGTTNLAISLRNTGQADALRATFDGVIYASGEMGNPKPLTMRISLEPSAGAQLGLSGSNSATFKFADGRQVNLFRFTSTFQAGNQTIRRTVLTGRGLDGPVHATIVDDPVQFIVGIYAVALIANYGYCVFVHV
jgi:hypothetical protein